jgi:hypothetical protein
MQELTASPFAALSYVSGPALLTNATSVLLLSTSNRFARATDRARALVAYLEGPGGARSKSGAAQELVWSQGRVRLIRTALTGYYLATAMFAMATMISIAGIVLSEYIGRFALDLILASAALSGSLGFVALVTGSVALIFESRLAVRSLRGEAMEATSTIERALHPPEAGNS